MSDITEGEKVAALVQLAGQAAMLAERFQDPRIQKVADIAVQQVQDSGALADILKLMASQPSPRDVQADERAALHREFHSNMNQRRQQATEMMSTLQNLLPQVIEQICRAKTSASNSSE